MVKKLILVDEGLWKAVRLRAVSSGWTVTQCVHSALTEWLSEPMVERPVPVPSAAEMWRRTATPIGTAAPAPVVAGGELRVAPASQPAPRSEPAIDARCVNCGERWAFHQLGASKTLAKNGCRRFVEA